MPRLRLAPSRSFTRIRPYHTDNGKAPHLIRLDPPAAQDLDLISRSLHPESLDQSAASASYARLRSGGLSPHEVIDYADDELKVNLLAAREMRHQSITSDIEKFRTLELSYGRSGAQLLSLLNKAGWSCK
jgi:hypothetical protein